LCSLFPNEDAQIQKIISDLQAPVFHAKVSAVGASPGYVLTLLVNVSAPFYSGFRVSDKLRTTVV
jgi:hypothetical protein